MLTPNIAPVTPLAREVETRLREWIQSGNYEAGDQLPSEREICEALNVNRRAVRTAIKLLERNGLLICRPNCRPIIAGSTVPVSAEPSAVGRQKLSNFVALMMWHGDAREEGDTGQERIFWGLNRTLHDAGYHTVYLDLGKSIAGEEGNAEREAAYLKYALEQGFGGIVLYCCSGDENRELLQRVSEEVPFILIDRLVYGVEADFVGIKNSEATYRATKYLQGLGHRRIGFVTLNRAISAIKEREHGYLQAMHDIDSDYEIVLPMSKKGNDCWPIGEAVFSLPTNERPTALVCVNDFEALTVHNLLAGKGIEVPRDVSIIGFDNLVTRLPNGVALTTVAQPYEEIGCEAARIFLRQVNAGKPARMHIECPTELIIRESCQPPLPTTNP